MDCPGCGNYGSDVMSAFNRGDPCPRCGLSAHAAMEVLATRVSRADSVLKLQVEALVKECDRLRRRLDAAEHACEAIKRAILEHDKFVLGTPRLDWERSYACAPTKGDA